MSETSEGSEYLVPFDGSLRVSSVATRPLSKIRLGKSASLKRELKATVKELRELQRKLYASDRYGVLLVFQAMDAAERMERFELS